MRLIKIIRFYIGRFLSVIIRFIGFLEFKNYYKNKKMTKEEQKVYDYISQKKQLSFIPYTFKEKYKISDIRINYDSGYPFVIHNGKKLYLKKQILKRLEKKIYNDLLIEKDEASPHSYTDEDFFVEEGSVLIDCGAAEGIFSLDNIDKCKKVYLIEPDEEWLKMLYKTFEPYKNKIEIIEKFVSDKNDANNITIDELLKEYKADDKIFIKADIEGFEHLMMVGAENSFEKFNNIKVSACLYHKDEEIYKIKEYFKDKRNFKIKINKGYLLYIYDVKRLKAPFLRNGVIKIKKEKII